MVLASWISKLFQALVLLLLPAPPPIFRQDDENFGRYYAAVMRVMRRVVHQVFLALRPANGFTPKQLLLDLPNYSNSQYGRLSDSIRHKLDNNHPTDTYDITLLYMLLQKVCGLTDQWAVPGTLENFLKRMKDKRNELSHEDLALDRPELERRVLELKDLCRQVLLMTSQKTGQALDGTVREMENGMDEVLTGGEEMFRHYRQALYELRQKQCSIMVREGKREIRSLSQRRRILNPFAWMLEGDFSKHTVGYVFTELALYNMESVEMANLLLTALPSGDLPETIILTGIPGIGKTSFLRFLLHDWLQDDPAIQGLDVYDLVLPIEARHVCSRNVCDLLRWELLPNTCRQLRVEDVVSTLQELSVAWLLDGYDEASQETRQLINEILTKFPHSKILISTRTECAREVQLAVSDVHRSQLLVQIGGFSVGNVKVCSRKIFELYITNNDEVHECVEKFFMFLKKQDNEMQAVFRVPLYLTMLTVLWIDKPSLVSEATSGTRIFIELIDHILNKMISREPFRRTGLSRRRLRERLDSFLDTLGETLALNYWELDMKNIKLLEELCEQLDLPFEETMSPFFTYIVEASASGTRDHYYVNHRTLAEFLFARVFCKRMISEGWDVLATIKVFLKRKLDISSPNVQDLIKEVYDEVSAISNVSKLLDDKEDCYEGLYEEEPFGCERLFNNLIIDDQKLDHALRLIGIQNSSYALKYVSGYLKVNNELTPQRAEQIFDVYSIGSRDEADWLSLVTETERDQSFLGTLVPHLSVFQWRVVPRNDHAVQELMKYVTPQSLLCQCSSEEEVRYLAEKAPKFSGISTELDIHFRNLYYEEDHRTDVVLGCLEAVLAENAKCRVTTLCCPVDVACLTILKKACHLRELLVKVNTLEEANLLAEVTRGLPQLEYLEIVFSPAVMAAEPSSLPTFDVFQQRGKYRSRQKCTSRKRKERSDEEGLNRELLYFYCRKWRLPSAHCNNGCPKVEASHQCSGCHHNPDGVFLDDQFDHFSAVKWHRRCIRLLRVQSFIARRIFAAFGLGGRGSRRKFNPYVIAEDPNGMWWLSLFHAVIRRLLRQHRESVSLHLRLVRFTYPPAKQDTVPIQLVFPKAFTMDPKKLGASVAKLCPNPSHVVLMGRSQDVHCIRTSLVLMWVYFSLSDVGLIKYVKFDDDNIRKEDYEESSKVIDLTSYFAPAIRIHWHYYGKRTSLT